LPESPPYFPKDELTDKTMRFFVSEIIREKIFLFYQKEIPYAVQIVIDSYKEEETLVRISAIIFVERDTQKGIIIGHQGKGLKKVGTAARQDIEDFIGKKVFLETFVKVRKNWRTSPKDLDAFGYE
jgi:GTP-binding protein Era